jgi:hypothetical protein
MLERQTPGFVAIEGPAHVYSEEAFRYFLGVERLRSERSGRPLLLLLIDLKGPRVTDAISHSIADSLFAAMTRCLRETDFVGWYHEGSVAGAVLMQRADAPGADASRQVHERVVRFMSEALPELADRLHVRVFQMPSKAKGSI